jgi:aspartokinase
LGDVLQEEQSNGRKEEKEKSEKSDDKMPTAVTIKDQIIVLNIHSNRKTISHGFLARIFGTLDRAGVVVDLISTSEVHVSGSSPSPAKVGLRAYLVFRCQWRCRISTPNIDLTAWYGIWKE